MCALSRVRHFFQWHKPFCWFLLFVFCLWNLLLLHHIMHWFARARQFGGDSFGGFLQAPFASVMWPLDDLMCALSWCNVRAVARPRRALVTHVRTPTQPKLTHARTAKQIETCTHNADTQTHIHLHHNYIRPPHTLTDMHSHSHSRAPGCCTRAHTHIHYELTHTCTHTHTTNTHMHSHSHTICMR